MEADVSRSARSICRHSVSAAGGSPVTLRSALRDSKGGGHLPPAHGGPVGLEDTQLTNTTATFFHSGFVPVPRR